MKHPRLWSALALILGANVLIITGVAYNRSGEPGTAIHLTERELPLSYTGEENTGISLRLVWHQPKTGKFATEDGSGGFDQAKLESLGFDCSVPLTDPQAGLYYRKVLPRDSYMVLEYEGKGWQDLLAEREQEIQRIAKEVEQQERAPKVLENAREVFERLRKTGSRLVVVDAGKDPAHLHQLYSDRSRFIVLPGVVSLGYVAQRTDKGGKIHQAYLYGRVSELLREEIHVPLANRSLLEPIRQEEQRERRTGRFSNRAGNDKGPRYSVVVNFGKKQEPWLINVEPLTPSQ